MCMVGVHWSRMYSRNDTMLPVCRSRLSETLGVGLLKQSFSVYISRSCWQRPVRTAFMHSMHGMSKNIMVWSASNDWEASKAMAVFQALLFVPVMCVCMYFCVFFFVTSHFMFLWCVALLPISHDSSQYSSLTFKVFSHCLCEVSRTHGYLRPKSLLLQTRIKEFYSYILAPCQRVHSKTYTLRVSFCFTKMCGQKIYTLFTLAPVTYICKPCWSPLLYRLTVSSHNWDPV